MTVRSFGEILTATADEATAGSLRRQACSAPTTAASIILIVVVAAISALQFGLLRATD
jgi:hypothetical protein